MDDYSLKKGLYPKIPSKDYPSEINRSGYIVFKKGDKFFIQYQLARHGGGERKFQISEEIYNFIVVNNVRLEDVFKKFKLYDKDILQNDVNFENI